MQTSNIDCISSLMFKIINQLELDKCHVYELLKLSPRLN